MIVSCCAALVFVGFRFELGGGGSSSGLLLAANRWGVKICFGNLDLLSSLSGEFVVLPTCRRSRLFLAATG
jgi:hypothetical protein